ncbi:LuxE/PaaK family acyltransferase [Duganella levis]|uniref:Acyl-protein synthetase n=1 Tax=Duganella levis TaxID=2692169 RepID=A0ABW9W854_9BURK|nr:acyl-protein synthetase [Duganella levis]MYN29774.1 acyl-protein synthetase [Duganella levis]
MSYYDHFAALNADQPYGLPAAEKQRLLVALLNELTAHHVQHSAPYAKIVASLALPAVAQRVEEVPFIPVRLFKHLDLLSVPRAEVFKTLTSSGTSGQAVSRIYLDRENAAMQTRVLGAIVAGFLGKQRRPMVVVDADNLLADRRQFNARAAGVLGFSVYGKEHAYALDAGMALKLEMLEAYCDQHRARGIYAFGFTFVVWKFLCQALERRGSRLDFGPDSILIHGGGWKKLTEESVSNEVFKATLLERAGLRRVHNYYGMVEQTGSIYMECEHGHLHASNYADVIVRDPISFKPAAVGEQGVLQVLSLLPRSYPGHSLLTEDVGVLLGEDDCPCGRMGKYFHVQGRMQSAEVRGCSDVRQF